MRWTAVVAIMFLTPVGQAKAEGWRDVFLTPDQQGWLEYRNKNFNKAAEVFADPWLRGMALFRDGQYETAAEVLSQIDTADAAFVQGISDIRSRSYRDGVRALERALEIDPTHEGAKTSLPIAKQIVTYVEETREQSDTGEDSGIGADDVVFDNEAAKGAETQIEVPEGDAAQHVTTEQWMNTVDTRTGDFLRQRFLLEASKVAE
ncbi:MAG: tetratricopeptide repeat protein [Paracoccaceae bacterium]